MNWRPVSQEKSPDHWVCEIRGPVCPFAIQVERSVRMAALEDDFMRKKLSFAVSILLGTLIGAAVGRPPAYLLPTRFEIDKRCCGLYLVNFPSDSWGSRCLKPIRQRLKPSIAALLSRTFASNHQLRSTGSIHRNAKTSRWKMSSRRWQGCSRARPNRKTRKRSFIYPSKYEDRLLARKSSKRPHVATD